MFRALFILAFLLIPSYAFAWGPLTHIYLGSEVFYLGAALPAGVYALLRKYRQDYLYGNLMADMILGKKYLPRKKHPHNWDVALNLFESAETEPEKAFAYGYMSHLAADTVAHGTFTSKRRNIGHAILELHADSIIDRKYWQEAVAIKSRVQERNDVFLESSLEKVIFSFKTNRRIFKGWIVLSGLNSERFRLLGRNPVVLPSKEELRSLHDESLDRIIDILQKGRRSEILKKDPIGNVRRGRLMSELLK